MNKIIKRFLSGLKLTAFMFLIAMACFFPIIGVMKTNDDRWLLFYIIHIILCIYAIGDKQTENE